MKNKWWSLIILLVGALIAGISLYQARVFSTLSRMGLLGQDKDQIFDSQQLAVELDTNQGWDCPKNMEVLGSIRYYLSTPKQKIDLGWKLGGERIVCGAREIVGGDGLTGTYKIMRGAKYWERSVALAEKMNMGCDLPQKIENVRTLGKLVELARGSARVEIGRIEEKLHERIIYETLRCIDQDIERE